MLHVWDQRRSRRWSLKGNFPHSKPGSSLSRAAHRLGPVEKMAALVDPSNARATNFRSVVWGALFTLSFSLLAMKQFKSVCQRLFFAHRSVHCVSFTCMECVGNVCEPKKQLTRVCSGDRHLSSHLTFTRAILPRSQCLCRCRSGKGKPKIFLPFDHSKARDFSDEEIATLRRWPVTGSKYSVVDRARTYTPTARCWPPSSL